MVNKNYSASVDAWVRRSQTRLLAVQRESIAEVIDIAQLATAKGGRMRVDTGFLRASGRLSLNGMPGGLVRGADGAGKESYEPESHELVLINMRLGETAYYGWSANYAQPRENKDAFLRLAVQQWPDIVKRVIVRAKARVK